MSEIEVTTIRVYTGDCDVRKAAPRLMGERIYATRRARTLPSGERVPAVNSWELLFDKKYVRRGGRFYFPEFDLEPTAGDGEDGIQLYAHVHYDRDGREQTMDGNVFTLPADFGPRVNFYHVLERYMRSTGELSSARVAANGS
jgi:hypothetical protein